MYCNEFQNIWRDRQAIFSNEIKNSDWVIEFAKESFNNDSQPNPYGTSPCKTSGDNTATVASKGSFVPFPLKGLAWQWTIKSTLAILQAQTWELLFWAAWSKIQQWMPPMIPPPLPVPSSTPSLLALAGFTAGQCCWGTVCPYHLWSLPQHLQHSWYLLSGCHKCDQSQRYKYTTGNKAHQIGPCIFPTMKDNNIWGLFSSGILEFSLQEALPNPLLEFRKITTTTTTVLSLTEIFIICQLI